MKNVHFLLLVEPQPAIAGAADGDPIVDQGRYKSFTFSIGAAMIELSHYPGQAKETGFLSSKERK